MRRSDAAKAPLRLLQVVSTVGFACAGGPLLLGLLMMVYRWGADGRAGLRMWLVHISEEGSATLFLQREWTWMQLLRPWMLLAALTLAFWVCRRQCERALVRRGPG